MSIFFAHVLHLKNKKKTPKKPEMIGLVFAMIPWPMSYCGRHFELADRWKAQSRDSPRPIAGQIERSIVSVSLPPITCVNSTQGKLEANKYFFKRL